MQRSRFRPAAAALATVLVASAAASVTSSDVRAQAVGAQIFDGVYSAPQAIRGKARFEENCASCHRADLTGAAAPALKGDGFLKKWEFQGLNALVSKVFDTMPQGYATNVQENVKVDIVSYILQSNGFPSGREELSGDLELLEDIQILAKPDAAQALDSIPNYSLIQVVGCLSKAADGNWRVSGAPDPSRTTSPEASSAASLERLKAKPAGTTSFRLINAARLNPDQMSGRRVETKGFVYQDGDQKLISVSALQTLGVTCQP
jgi:cytochrome c5